MRWFPLFFNLKVFMTFTPRAFLLIGAVALAGLLGACASKVPLTEPVAVEDKSGQPVVVSQPAGTGTTNPVGSRDVKPVNVVVDTVAVNGGVVYFDFDSSAIKPEFQSLIEGQAKRMSANRALKATLAGHTDEVGGREYNLALGQKRAETVRKALSLLGASDSQLEAVSFGKEKPAMAGNTEAALEKNRRAEISYR